MLHRVKPERRNRIRPEHAERRSQRQGKLVESYLPYVASTLKRLPAKHQTLELIYRCYASLEKAVDRFDFLQDSEPFSHRLNWWMRQTITAYLADRDT